MNCLDLINKLHIERTLTRDEFLFLLSNIDKESKAHLHALAKEETQKIYGNKVFPRGLIEYTNYCKNNCYYCGIRNANTNVHRYRLTKDVILRACHDGYLTGYRSFVLQGGEDPYFDDDKMTDIVAGISNEFPDCSITLSLGERSKESYKRLRQAGGERYLLRHETITDTHYQKLHPSSMSLKTRRQCLEDLREVGFVVGTGFMVGAPHQTLEHLADDLLFIKEFQPKMVGIGPFVPHHDTPFKDYPAGTVDLTTTLISILRLMMPHLLLPSTTALATISDDGREQGILAGANVVMPNLSPHEVRKDYTLYDNKAFSNAESVEMTAQLQKQLEAIGYTLDFSRGDPK